jgi:hypothetical protein
MDDLPSERGQLIITDTLAGDRHEGITTVQVAVGADGAPGTADDDLHVLGASPAVDAGNNADIPADLTDDHQNGNTSEPISRDLDAQPRLANGTVDLGAYQATSSAPTATMSPTPLATPGRSWKGYYLPFVGR